HSYKDVQDEVKAHKVNDKVNLKVQRSGKPMEVELTFTAPPAPAPSPRGPGAPPPQPGERGPAADRPYGSVLGGQPENIQDRQGREGFQYGGIYKSTDGGESWSRINSLNPRPMYFSCIRVDPSDEKYLYVLGISMYRSKDGGKTFQGDAGRDVH